MQSVARFRQATYSVSVFFLMAVVSLNSCIRVSEESYFGTTVPQHGPDELWINNGAEPQYIDPQKVSGVPDGEVVRNMFARLIQIDPITGKVIPDLAHKWERSDDGREYIFHLREGLQWSDGVPLTAKTVEWSWKRALQPETASVYAEMAAAIQHGDLLIRGYLWFQNLPKTLDLEQFSAELKQVAPIKDIQSSDMLDGLFVNPEGAGEEKKKYQKALMDRYHGIILEGEQIQVAPVDDSVVQVKALDEKRLWVRLIGPLPYFLPLLDFNLFSPSPKHVIERVKRETGSADTWTRLENIVCSGAYCLNQDEFRYKKTFVKNPKYWNAKHVSLNKVVMYSIESQITPLFMYRTGQLDWTGASNTLPSEYVSRLNHLNDYHNDAYLSVEYYAFNVNKAPFDDVRVRQALGLAIDRNELAEVAGAGQIPYASMVPDGLAGYKGLKAPLFDKKKAQKLLAQAGYPGGKGFPKGVKIMFNTKELNKTLAEKIQQMWKSNLGIEVELDNREWKVYLDDLTSQNYQVARRGWTGDYIDPYTFLELYISTNGNNRSGWGSKEYDDLIFEANKQADLDKRLSMFREAEQIAYDGHAFEALFISTRTYLLKPYVKGFWPDYQNHHLWKHMWIDKKWYDGKDHLSNEGKKP